MVVVPAIAADAAVMAATIGSNSSNCRSSIVATVAVAVVVAAAAAAVESKNRGRLGSRSRSGSSGGGTVALSFHRHSNFHLLTPLNP